MLCRRKIWLAVLVTMLVCLLPTTGFCRLAPIDARDEYINTRLFLDLDYEYQSKTSKNNKRESTKSSLLQTYDLKLSGNFLDPRLIIWDTDIRYRTKTTDSGTSSIDNNLWRYRARTTIMRKLKYPLTLYGSRQTSYSSNSDYDQVVDNYGFKWQFKFIRLPEVSINMNRTVNDTGLTQRVSSNYNFNFVKDTDTSKNRLNYSISDTEDTSIKSLTMVSDTDISEKTSFTLGTVQTNVSDKASSRLDGESVGVYMQLDSSPSRYVKHSHAYTLALSDDGISDYSSSFYRGSLRYSPLGKFSSSLRYSYSQDAAESPSSDNESINLVLGANFSYRLTNRLGFNQNLTYRNSERTTKSAVTNVSGSTEYATHSSLSYHRAIKTAQLSGSYGVGFNMIETEPDGETSLRLAQKFNIGLSNVHLKLVKLHTTGYMNRNDNLSGNYWDRSQGYSIDGTNTVLQKYILIVAGYSFREYLYSEPARNTRSETVRLKINLRFARSKFFKIFKNTTVSTTTSYNQSRALANEPLHTYEFGLKVAHSQKIFKEKVNFGAGWRLFKLKSRTIDDERLRTKYNVSYSKTFRKIKWNTAIARTINEDRRSDHQHTITRFTNRLSYKLRAWTLSADYWITEFQFQEDDPYSESRIFFKAHRTIGRMFY